MSGSRGSRSAWMIEDDEMIARLVRFKLEKSGWSLDVFRTIGEFRVGWGRADLVRPSVLMLDRNLPDGSGLALARELVAMNDGKPTAYLLLSASPRDSETPEGVQWMRKPFEPAQLLEVLEQLRVQAARSGPGGLGAVQDPELAALQAEYRASLPVKAGMVETLREAGNWAELSVLAHQLAGSAGLYGFPEIQRAAAALEDSLRSGGESSAELDSLYRALVGEMP